MNVEVWAFNLLKEIKGKKAINGWSKDKNHDVHYL